MLSQLVIEEIRLGFSQGDFMLNVPPNEVHRNEWGELVCNVYDEDNIFLYTEKIDEDIYKTNGAVVPVDWARQQDKDFKELRL